MISTSTRGSIRQLENAFAWRELFIFFVLHLNKRICCGGEGRITSTTKTNEMWRDGLNDFRLLCPQLRARGLKKRKRLNPIHVA